ncbi:hypothetical protein V6C27_12125 [Peptococcaceae bacterium 1198_IL3148]
MYYPPPNDGYQQNQLEPNAYTLFLIFILLVLGTNRDFDDRLGYITNVLKASHNAVRMMRSGMNEFHASVLNDNTRGQ